MDLVSASNPQWANAEHSAILLNVVFTELAPEVVPFYASSDDPEPHGQDIFARAKNREFGEVAPFVAPTRTWAEYQQLAKAALDRTDLVALRCWKANVPYPVAWQTYTDALRAIIRAPSGDPEQPLPTQPDYPAGT